MFRAGPLRRLLLLEFALGAFVSALASGRYSVRLILDGAISCAFIPAIEVAVLAIVLSARTGRPLPFPQTLERYLAGNTPWLIWLAGVAAVASVVPPHQVGLLFWPAMAAAIVPAGWSVRRDLAFFSTAMARSATQARGDVVFVRALGWPLATAYFLGIAIWTELPGLFRSLGL